MPTRENELRRRLRRRAARPDGRRRPPPAEDRGVVGDADARAMLEQLRERRIEERRRARRPPSRRGRSSRRRRRRRARPPASTPSTGTGKRSAKIEAARRAASPIRVVVLCCERANETAPASVTAMPAAQTGARTARSLGGGSLCSTAPLPVQVKHEVLAVTADDGDHKKREDCDERKEALAPLQHREPPQNPKHDSAILKSRRGCCIPRTGETCEAAITAYGPETRPASASGRRPQAKLWRYQPVSGVTATPSPEEWTIQPAPR